MTHSASISWLLSRPRRLLACAIVMVAGFMLFGLSHNASALSGRGPDLTELGMAPSEKAGYVLIDTGAASIRLTQIPLYFTNNTSDKTVTVVGGDLCAANGAPAGYRDRNNPSYGGGTVVASYMIPGAPTIYGRVNTGGGCGDAAKSTVIPRANLAFDTATGYYIARFMATIPAGITNVENVYHIQLAESGAIVGYSSSNASSSFGIEQESPQGGYQKYDMPFAPDCSLTQNKNVSIDIYDPDNGDPSIQPAKFAVRIRDKSVPGWPVIASGVPGSVSGSTFTLNFTVAPGHKYSMAVDSVYSVNILQFRLPYDSIYSEVTCPPKIINANVDCNYLKFRVEDPSGQHYSARLVHIKSDGTEEDSSVISDLAPSSTPGVNVQTFDVGSWRDFSSGHKFKVRVRSISNPDIYRESDVVTQSGPCATAQCTGVTAEPADIDPGQTFRLKVSMNTDIGSKGNSTLYLANLSLDGSPAIVAKAGSPGGSSASGTTVGGGVGPGGGGGNSETMEWDVTYSSAGEYHGAVSVGGGFTLSCPINNGSSIIVSNHPYLRVYHGDVLAGCDTGGAHWYPTDPSGSNAGRILTWSQSNGSLRGGGSNASPKNGYGSGTDLAAQALGKIEGFSSAQQTGMTVDDLLTFANSTGDNFGGNFGTGLCPDDAFAGAASAEPVGSDVATLPVPNGSFVYTGNKTIYGGSPGSPLPLTLQPGQHQTIYVDGDLTIRSDIYVNGEPWSSIADIPSLRIVVKGNIYIDSSVGSIFANLVAQPKDASAGGNIYTCTNGGSLYADQASLYGKCNNDLTITGSLTARRIAFLRLAGSTNTANPADSIPSSTAAEKIVNSPATWLSDPAATSTAATYDAISSLPPVF